VHGVLGALLLSIGGSDPTPPPATIDVVEIVPAPLPPPPPPATIVAKLEGGGGGGTPAPLRPKATVRPAAHSLREALGDVTIERGTGDGGSGGGDGGGIGGGHGRGIGLGEGGGAVFQTVALPAPPAAPISKARPPKLIYPTHEHHYSNGDDEVFVARVTIDRDGFVVGAKLVHRLHDRRDDQAQSAIFRFRYAPALDDDGRAITATIDQPFMVE